MTNESQTLSSQLPQSFYLLCDVSHVNVSSQGLAGVEELLVLGIEPGLDDTPGQEIIGQNLSIG